jgi:ankyrin repeat protein
MWAALVGNKEIVEALLAAGANPNLADVLGDTASAWAKKNKHVEIAALLDRTQ